jgi:uncharacterized membrane protein
MPPGAGGPSSAAATSVGIVSYEDFASASVKVIESTGGAIMVLGGLVAFVRYARQSMRQGAGAYRQLRANLGRVILLGLEVLIIADIVRTIVVDQSVQSVGVLGLIVVIRIVLSFSLEVEIEGAWPWNEWKAKRTSSSPTGSTETPAGDSPA